MPVRIAVMAALAVGVVAGCGGSGGSGPAAQTAPTTRTAPDLAGFLRLPVATPTSCPDESNGMTTGRRSPWVGHVDVSVFVLNDALQRQVDALDTTLRRLPQVQRVYYESRPQAWAEFERLYACSAEVDRSVVPASFRLVLRPVTRQQRDDLVRRIIRMPGVDTVSCDPSSPCVDVVRQK